MQYMVMGIFAGYEEAEAAVQDLEIAGITGGQVEMISDIDEDARTVDTPGEPLTTPEDERKGWRAKLFGPGGPLHRPEARDTPGEQPNYIGDQEFYATHIKQGGAVLIVRVPAEAVANRAAAIMKDHGGRTPGKKDGPAVQRVN